MEKGANCQNYLAQEEIHSDLYKGKRFDFRILAHAEKDGFICHWSRDQTISRTADYHPYPTAAGCFPMSCCNPVNMTGLFKRAVQQIGKALSEQFGYFGEFSIDAGLVNPVTIIFMKSIPNR